MPPAAKLEAKKAELKELKRPAPVKKPRAPKKPRKTKNPKKPVEGDAE